MCADWFGYDLEKIPKDEVLYRVEGRVAYVTLNRPHSMNAITVTLPLALARAIHVANQDGKLPNLYSPVSAEFAPVTWIERRLFIA